MYVQCERCKTEYEFDDALVSERGTTVKCTSCGHQFKVRRAGGGGSEQDRWVVTNTAGKTLVFTSLKELQRAILAKLVEKTDMLARGNAPPRSLGQIAELEPFFDERRSRMGSTPPPGDVGVMRRPMSSRPPPIPGTAGSSLSSPPRARAKSIPPPLPPEALGPMRARTDTLRPMDVGVPPPADPHAVRPAAGSDIGKSTAPQFSSNSPKTLLGGVQAPSAPPEPTAIRSGTTQAGLPPAPHAVSATHPQRPAPPPPPKRAPLPPPSIDPTEAIETSSPLPPPTAPVRRSLPSDYDDEPPRRERLGSFVDRESGPPRRRLGGWVIALVLFGGVAVIGFYALKPYLARMSAAPVANAPLDPRAQQYLKEGEAALDQGNLDLAKEDFDKASVLAEKDPHILIDVARLATMRADIPWLRQRLLPNDSEETRVNKLQLDELSLKARRAAEDAVAAAPDDASARRVKVDALRIGGDRDAARSLVGSVAVNASQPDTAYVLGALDLAEIDPPWNIVIERLRTAANGEGTAGRARAALVYALARSGDPSGARQELDRLLSLQRPHPLAPLLKAYVEHAAAGPGDAGAGLAGVGASATSAFQPGQFHPGPNAVTPPPGVTGLPPGPAQPPPGPATAGTGAAPPPVAAGGNLPTDPRQLLKMADAAKNKGDYARARSLYDATLAKNPSDSEALAGLGDVSRSEHDLAGAQAFYKRALGVNPTYLPAIIGLGDVQWESGDRGAAVKTYKDIMDRFPEGTYPARVKQRVDAAAGGSSGSTPGSTTPKDPSVGTPEIP